jgi:phosphoribosyl-dephospho-CoA transferase
MNALELADLLDECMEDGSTDLVCVEQAATMLRQQQAEIEALKAQIAELTEQNDAYYEESGKTY